MNKYDAVIIGGGIGGLTCALLLAKKGARVAVFEKEKRPGGYCSSFSVDGYTFDACVDSIGGLRKDEPLRHIIEEKLGIWDELDFIELNPLRRNIFPDMAVDIPADVTQYKDTLKMIFPAEQEGIDRSFSAMEKIYMSSLQTMCGTGDGSLLYDFMEISFYDLLSSFISDEKLKSVLSTYCTFLGLPAREASAIALSNILIHYVRGGAFRIRGGIQGLSNALVGALRNRGGEVFFTEEVTRILYDETNTTGIVTKGGRKVKAAHIISNMDIKTVIRLMEGCAVDKEKVNKIKKMKVSGSFVMVYIGVNDNLRSYGLPPDLGYFNSYDLDGMLNKNAHASFGLSFPSALDSSVAPKECGSIVIHWPMCYNKHSTAISKDDIGKRLVAELSKIVPGIANRIVYQSIAGPCTLQRYTGNTFGAAYGWEQEAGFLENLPFMRNIAGNFHVVGHWAGYGGGVMPSMLSACKVAKDIAGG